MIKDYLIHILDSVSQVTRKDEYGKSTYKVVYKDIPARVELGALVTNNPNLIGIHVDATIYIEPQYIIDSEYRIKFKTKVLEVVRVNPQYGLSDDKEFTVLYCNEVTE
jgi:hypothetical protein